MSPAFEVVDNSGKPADAYDVIIVGGGVTGTALLYALAAFTNVGRVLLLERRSALAQVSSAAAHNSQTLHFGDIETNYTAEKAAAVKAAAEMVVSYAESHGLTEGSAPVVRPMQKMVLGVGAKEVAELTARHAAFRALFPQLEMLDTDGIRLREPGVMDGRDPSEPVAALFSQRGYAVDFGRLSDSFVAQAAAARAQAGMPSPIVRHDVEVRAVRRDGEGFTVDTDHGAFSSRAVVVSAGSLSLELAQRMGLGRDLTLLPVAGDFFSAPNLLRGKVYTVQAKGLPFAAVHGDPDVNDLSRMRFGPIAVATPKLEPDRLGSIAAFFRVFRLNWPTFATVWRVNSDPVVLRFVLRHLQYYAPFVGKRLFLGDVRRIVPSLRAKDLRFERRMGGVRPQVANVRTRQLLLGEAKISEPGAIFNITPSPGASVCLKTAVDDARALCVHLGAEFNESRRAATLGA